MRDFQASTLNGRPILLDAPKFRTKKPPRHFPHPYRFHRPRPRRQQESSAGPKGTRDVFEEARLVQKVLGRFHYPDQIKLRFGKDKLLSVRDDNINANPSFLRQLASNPRLLRA